MNLACRPADRVVSGKGRPTISQVAKELGIAKSTVSHAFSGRGRISDDLKERIFEVAKRMDYQPHYAAQVLANRRTMNLGLLVRQATDQYFPQFLQAMSATASKRGYRLSMGIADSDPVRMESYINDFSRGQTDGVLVLTCDLPDERIVELTRRGYPVGTALHVVPGYEELSGVMLNIGDAYGQLLEYLHSLGHREFGFLCGIPREVPQRYQRMLRFAQEKGLTFGPQRIVSHLEGIEMGEPAAMQLLKQSPEITAIVCSNDSLAVGAMIAAHELKIRVPDDLTITGFDDVAISRSCIPRLTTIRMPVAEIATAAVNRLVDRIEGKPAAPIVRLTPELIIRGSSGPVRGQRQ